MPPPINLDQLIAVAEQAKDQVTQVVTSAGTQMEAVVGEASTQLGKVGEAAQTVATVATKGAADLKATLTRALDELRRTANSARGKVQELIEGIPRFELPVQIKVNGIAVAPDNPDELFTTIKSLAEGGKTIEIHIEGPLALPLIPVTTNREEMRQLLLTRFGLAGSAVLKPNPVAESVIITIVICLTITAIALGLGGPLVLGTAAIMFSLAAALLVALALGYDVEARLCDVLGVTPPPGFPGANLNLCKEFILTKKR